VAGVLFRHGDLIAQWGDVHRSDLTFSVAKTYLALLAGLAFDDGLLPDVHEPVIERCPGIGFEGEHNARITWHHLLQQTSEWEGTCLGIPEQGRPLPLGQSSARRGRGEEGRSAAVGRAGVTLRIQRRAHQSVVAGAAAPMAAPLPEVFGERILAPTQCMDPFQWEGYDQGWTDVGGKRMLSVPGGSHWGGGVSISAMDQARIGLMLMQQGRFEGRDVLSSQWIARMQQPCEVAPFYGYLVWLNQTGQLFPAAPRSSWFAIGAGSSLTWIDAELKVVCVLRWIDSAKANDCIARVMNCMDWGQSSIGLVAWGQS